jgi:Na+-translocating ferredoxin:NAD+ oxidoreductase subunit C
VLKTFPRGGIHPSENKITAGEPIKVLPLPESVVIPVAQHLGNPADIIVNKGDLVVTGQLIATAHGMISSNIHSSVSGKVSKIDTITDISGNRQTAIFIDREGDEWIESIDRTATVNSNILLSAEDIRKRCYESGVVGLGGAAFPSHVKLTIPEGKNCDVLLINGVECEPYLTSDHRLMLEHGMEVLIGVAILMKALNTGRAMIGIENNKPDAIANLAKLSESFKGITIHPLKVKYPQGAEKQLIKALIGREVPSGKLPIEIGAVVQNVGTAYATYEAVQKNKPLIERVVTITGRSVVQPGNFLVRIGTQVSKLIEAAGGMPDDTGKIVNGGPMMGKAMNIIDVPIMKATSGIVLIPSVDAVRQPFGPCIRCAKCVTACGNSLEPFLLMTLAEKGYFERLENERIIDCMECGSCSFVCPACRPVLDYIRLGKSEVKRMLRERAIK